MDKRICLKGSPRSTNNIYRYHSKGGYMTKEGKVLKDDYMWRAKSQWNRPVTSKPLEVVIELYFGDRRIRDIDNYNKLILDALSGIVYKDDKQIQKLTITKYYDKEMPRAEVEIKNY